MTLETRPRAPRAVRWIVHTLEEAGYETWAVGGAVRDALLGLPGSDWDLATRARPEEVRALFRRTVPIGVEHGTVGVLTRQGQLYEVTTFRRDVVTFGRHARVEFAEEVETDLGRRDFTINAIGWHPVREEIRDPFGGLDDLRVGVLRTVGAPADRFREDYLRVLRALRFAGQFGMEIEPSTWTALCASKDRLHDLSPERIREELLKILTGADRASGALGLYGASGVLAELYPELQGLVGRARPDGGPGDLWTRSVLAADALGPHRPLLRLTAVLADLGQPDPDESSPPRGPDPGQAPDPRERGALRSAAILARLRFANAEVREVAGLVDAIQRPRPADCEPRAVRRWLALVGAERLPSVFRVLVARARIDRALGAPGHREVELLSLWREARRQIQAGAPLKVSDLALNGEDLLDMGLEPGPQFGDVLDRLLDRVLDEPARNRREELEAQVGEWVKAGELRMKEGGPRDG